MIRFVSRLRLVTFALSSATLGVLAACSGDDDAAPGAPAPGTTCDACTPVTTGDGGDGDGGTSGSPDASSSPDASGSDEDNTPIACSESFASFCNVASCISTYSVASKATAYCGTDATQVTEYPGACDGYDYVSVVANGATTNYYYDLTTGDAVAAVVAGDGGQMCIGSTSSGSVPSSPCDFAGMVTVLDTVCAGMADGGRDAN